MSSAQLYPYWLGNNPQPLPYGSFSSNTNQKVTGANVTTVLQFDTTEGASQIFNGSGKITVQATGVYKILYSIQVDTSSGGQQSLYVWLRKNGVNIPRSASYFTLQNNGENIAASEIIASLLAGDYIEVVFQSADANMTASYIAPGGVAPNNYPASPSVILDINKIA